MIISITGATGFIGQKLVLKHLDLGDQVRVFSRRKYEDTALPSGLDWFHGDLSTTDSLHTFLDGADVLYHCAGEVRNDQLMDDLHVAGTRRLVAAAAGRIDHWVQLSSVGVYGQVSSGTITEASPIKPTGLYEITKEMSERIVIDGANKHGFSYSILRPSNVYGATMTNQSLFKMIAMIEKGLFFYIGRPGASANYIHVDNVVNALTLIATDKRAFGQTYNLSDFSTMEFFVETISKLLNKPAPKLRLPKIPVTLAAKLIGGVSESPITLARVNALTRRVYYPNNKIESELGYHHIVAMDSGLAELVECWLSKKSVEL